LRYSVIPTPLWTHPELGEPRSSTRSEGVIIAPKGERVVLQTTSRNISKDIIIGIVVTSFIFLMSVVIPIIGFFSALLIPLPTLFYRSKLGRTSGAVIPVIATIIMVAFLGGISIDILSIEKTVLYACGAVIVTGTVCLLFYSNIANKGIYALVNEYVDKNLKLTLSLYSNMGIKPENIQMISNSLENIKYVLVRIIPALVVSSAVFISWTNLLLAKPIFKNQNLFYPDFGSLKLWKAAEFLVWGVICFGLLLLFPYKPIKVLGLNGLLILITVYFFQGIAIVSFYFEKKKFPRLLRFFLYTLMAVQQIVLLVVIGIGFFDMWLNFRKLGHSPSKPEK
jgi:uncharacterized protein YybS (DUF2232 family)